MKASELINLYQQGRRNFSRENLINQNFNDQQLFNINLSHTDLRGASFINANLTGSNFTYAKAGSIFAVSFIRTIFQLIVACSTMSLSIYYCLSFSSDLSNFLIRLKHSDTGGMIFLDLFVIGIPSLLFLIFSSTWISKNSTMVLCCYFTTVLVVNIIVYFSTNETALIGGLFFYSIMLSPLIILVSTTVHYIVESLPYRGTWTWQATSFRGANLEKSDFSKATLGNTDFRFSQLEGTCFYQAKHLNLKLFENTRLAKRNLLVKSTITKRNTLY